jgi:hypothetical protein
MTRHALPIWLALCGAASIGCGGVDCPGDAGFSFAVTLTVPSADLPPDLTISLTSDGGTWTFTEADFAAPAPFQFDPACWREGSPVYCGWGPENGEPNGVGIFSADAQGYKPVTVTLTTEGDCQEHLQKSAALEPE